MYLIEDYSFGRMVIDGKAYTSDVIIFPDRVISSWWRESGHFLSLKDIEVVLEQRPEVLVVGTGSTGLMQVSSEVVKEIRKMGIEVIIQKTSSACRTFNQLAGKKFVVGAFHLTC